MWIQNKKNIKDLRVYGVVNMDGEIQDVKCPRGKFYEQHGHARRRSLMIPNTRVVEFKLVMVEEGQNGV